MYTKPGYVFTHQTALLLRVTLITMATNLPAEHRATPAGKPRARALGLSFGGRPGRWNAITDGGTGMNCYQFKGGSGTASRLVPFVGQEYTVGVFVQANFGRRPELVLAGIPLGEALAADNPMADRFAAPPGSGSVIALVATDAPLISHQCQAFARRVTAGLARTGTSGSHFSGDLFLAFSTANPGAFRPGAQARQRLEFIPWEHLDPFFEAVVQATEEAVVNALVANEDMTGRDGHRTPALPRAKVVELLAATGRTPKFR